jgi:hypothetical protein
MWEPVAEFFLNKYLHEKLRLEMRRNLKLEDLLMRWTIRLKI